MKKTLTILAILALAGCATTAPSNAYRAAGQVDAWRIGGSGNPLTGSVTITINGQTVIDDSITPLGLDREFNSTYQGKAISANCHGVSSLLSENIDCMVFVNNERASTLKF